MARRRGKRRVYGKFGGAEVGYEWLGFRDSGVAGNLNTRTSFELVPSAGASSAIHPDLVVMRIVGDVSVRQQAGVTTSSRLGLLIGVSNVGGDQVIDNPFNPISTDVDDFDHPGIMFWRNWQTPQYGVSMADADNQEMTIPIDVKTKRKLNKRDTLVCVMEAGSTNTLRASCNLRVYIKIK